MTPDEHLLPIPPARRLGKEIHKARIDRDLTRQALADLLGMDIEKLSAIERGEIDPRWSSLVKLSLALEPYLHLDRVAWDTHRDQQGLYEEDARHE